ncbi:hypothetical protein RvY_10961 [Ramazzottius varieornatus]|uniref:Band 7 domain-containing protein n=1 Tax=Ramazzottius varieornatus TaxID=947166 RepID=A0A1D1VEH8_RAMVA|nr:hypothetical protein RvY_10961 [Ramazzottius varieornatus]
MAVSMEPLLRTVVRAEQSARSVQLISSRSFAALKKNQRASAINNQAPAKPTAVTPSPMFQLSHDTPFTIHQRSVSTPINTIINFVPQQEAWVIERMGKFSRILEPGVNILVPVIDRIRYVQTLKEIAIEVPKQTAITSDSVALSLDGVLFVRIVDAYKASYGVEDPEFAVTQLAQTTMRSELGKISLDHVFKERESLNTKIVQAINNASAAWGIACMRYEIRDIHLPVNVQEAMQMQVAAERRKRAVVLDSEGVREAEVNIAEGKKRSQILQSEAFKTETINKAEGEASAIMAKAKARAIGIQNVAESLQGTNASDAASLIVAEQYVQAFSKLAKESNTLIIPSASGDIAGSVAQAMAIFKSVSNNANGQKNEVSVDSVNSAGRRNGKDKDEPLKSRSKQ